MWLLQNYIVVSLALYSTVAHPDFRHRADMVIHNLDIGTFAEFYIKEGELYQPIEFMEQPKNLMYFPKCCPPGYSYGVLKHNCVEDPKSDIPINTNINVIKTGLNCEVIVDHIVPIQEFDIDDDTKTVSFRDKDINFGQYCIDFETFHNLTYIVRECKSIDYCLSSEKHDFCVKKCCSDGFQYINRTCTRNPTFGMDMDEYKNMSLGYQESFAIYYQPSTCSKYIWNHENGITIAYDGMVLIDTKHTLENYTIDEEMYCIEGNRMKHSNETFSVFLLCVNTDVHYSFQISRVILLISCFCLLLTVLVFIVIGKLRTLMGKIVTCYSSIMFMAFLLLSIAQFYPNLQSACKPVGYSILFAFTATFTWMNVMCYEIWKTLGFVYTSSMKSGIPIGEQTKVFIKYNIYAWGVPIIVIFLTFIFNMFRVLPDTIHPFIGETHCILENRISENLYGHTLFLVLPQAIMLCINGVFFIGTLRHFKNLKYQTPNLQSSPQAKKKIRIQKHDLKRFGMMTKLFFIMGLSWIFEVISAIIDFKQDTIMAVIEQFFDIFNCLQGVLIFCVFVLNRNFIRRLLKRCSSNKKRNDNVKVSSVSSSEFSAEEQEMAQTA